jgi:hypothetical protein
MYILCTCLVIWIDYSSINQEDPCLEIDVNHNLKNKKSLLWELNDDADADQIDDDDDDDDGAKI